MKKFITSLAVLAIFASAANADVWINEVLTNPNGSDSTATTGNEHFELRGTPGMSLWGYYLLSVEGGGTTGRGDINQFFDLRSVLDRRKRVSVRPPELQPLHRNCHRGDGDSEYRGPGMGADWCQHSRPQRGWHPG